MKNIVVLFISLLIIMIISTIIVLTFNSFVQFSTDMNNEDVATSIAAIAFFIALILKYLSDK